VRAQFSGLRFQLFDREPAHERGVIHEAVFVAAEEIPRDPAAGGFVRGGASSLRAARISGANRVTYLSDHASSGAITASGMRGVRFSPATKR
jgi:hypothetical protein